MRSCVREVLRKLEDHCRPQALGDPIRTTPGLDDRDEFAKGGLTLLGVLELKRILTKLDEPVRNEHYNTAYAAKEDRVITREEWQMLEQELGKPRSFPQPTLPDRALTAKEKARTLHIVENSLREFGLVDSPLSTHIVLEVPTGNGQNTEPLSVPDSAVGRRLKALLTELQALRAEILPEEAKEHYKYAGGFGLKSDWARTHMRYCHGCGSVCDVYSHNFDKK